MTTKLHALGGCHVPVWRGGGGGGEHRVGVPVGSDGSAHFGACFVDSGGRRPMLWRCCVLFIESKSLLVPTGHERALLLHVGSHRLRRACAKAQARTWFSLRQGVSGRGLRLPSSVARTPEPPEPDQHSLPYWDGGGGGGHQG